MTLLDRYIGRSVLAGTGLVLFLLLALFFFISMLAELGRIGRGNYGFFEAVQYVGLLMPSLAYQLIPLASMMGALAGLGMLAGNSELTVMRASGVPVWRIVFAVFKSGLIVIAFAAVISEFLVAETEERAYELRSSAMAGHSRGVGEEGFWTRNADSYIYVDRVSVGTRLLGIRVYEFDGIHRLKKITMARSAHFTGQGWLLVSVEQMTLQGDELQVEKNNAVSWDSLLDPDMLRVIDLNPARMPMRELVHYIDYLDENGLGTLHYEKALWSKLTMPLGTLVMFLLAVPFVFGSLRSVGIGQRMLVGGLVGIGFYLFDQIVSYAGLAFELSPMFTALAPSLLLIIVTAGLYRKIR